MNITVLGWYGHGNIGDEAFKLAFPMVFTNHTVECIESIESGHVTDVVILGGGDVVYPSFTKYLDNVPDARKIVASVTLTDNSDFDSLPRFEKRFVRDYRSLGIAKKRGYACDYLPDFAFALNPDRQAGQELIRKLFKSQGRYLKKKVVVMVISNYLAYSQLDLLARDFTTFIKLSQDLAQVADDTDASFLFVPFSTSSPQDDRITNSWVSGRCRDYNKNVVIYECLSVQDTLNIIAGADAVVSSRLHSSIFSTLSSVPFIDLTHHTKSLGYLELIDKTQWSIPFWEFSIRRYADTLHTFLDQGYPDYQLAEFTKTAKEQLRDAIIL